MRALRANFGDQENVYVGGDGVAAVQLGTQWYTLDDPPRVTPYDGFYNPVEPPRGPFERSDFGDRDRFVWPTGACALPQSVQPRYWGERFAYWFVDTTLVLIDATRPRVIGLDLPTLADGSSRIVVDATRMWLGSRRDAIGLMLTELAALFDAEPGPQTIEVHELYPRRVLDRVIEARILAVGESEVTARTIQELRSVRLPRVPGLEREMVIKLSDELVRDRYLQVELPDGSRIALPIEIPTTSTHLVMLGEREAIDPAGAIARPAEQMRQGDLDRLFSTLADDPDDEATRSVIVDLLEAAGETYAVDLATLLLGNGAGRQAALGTLASYLEDIEYHSHFLRAARLAATAPLDDEIGDMVAADQRLGFLHTLRIGDGHYNVYAKLVGSPRAVGLRHVDVPRFSVLAALIAGKRTELRRLSNVKFATRDVIEALADPTFDSVRELHTETRQAAVAKLLEFVIRDETEFFARAPRHLILGDRPGYAFQLVDAVLAVWDRLPVPAVSVAGVTLYRDGTATADRDAAGVSLDKIRTRFTLQT